MSTRFQRVLHLLVKIAFVVVILGFQICFTMFDPTFYVRNRNPSGGIPLFESKASENSTMNKIYLRGEWINASHDAFGRLTLADARHRNESKLLLKTEWKNCYENVDEKLAEEWNVVISDWLRPYSRGISRDDLDLTWDNYGKGEHIIIRYHSESRNIYLSDPQKYCTTGGKDNKLFHRDRCAAMYSVLNATMALQSSQCRLPDFEFVYSLDDLPEFRSFQNTRELALMPGFGPIRCWQKGFMSFPMFGSHGRWDIQELNSKISDWLSLELPRFEDRLPLLVFRGGNRACSFSPEKNSAIDWLKNEFYGAPNPCGRALMKRIAKRNRKLIDYSDDFLSMAQQASRFKYMISVEGHGGWADRLFELIFYDVGLFVQDHPCPEWFEYMFKPFQHYIPVANNFSDVIGRVEWAEHHPHLVEKMIKDRRSRARRILSQRGVLTFSLVLWTKYSRLMTDEITPRRDEIDFQLLENTN